MAVQCLRNVCETNCKLWRRSSSPQHILKQTSGRQKKQSIKKHRSHNTNWQPHRQTQNMLQTKESMLQTKKWQLSIGLFSWCKYVFIKQSIKECKQSRKEKENKLAYTYTQNRLFLVTVPQIRYFFDRWLDLRSEFEHNPCTPAHSEFFFHSLHLSSQGHSPEELDKIIIDHI